jgi:hypothetical protein
VVDVLSIAAFPKSICWNAVGMKWRVSFKEGSSNRRLRLAYSYPEVEFTFPKGQQTDCFGLYKRWFVAQAAVVMTPLLEQISRDCGLPFASVSYGHQKSLWGSCSSDKKIRLNAKLLYLPPRMLRYVLVHELCHTRHMNHQPEFWSLVEQHEPDYRQLRRQLRHADQYIPALLNR